MPRAAVALNTSSSVGAFTNAELFSNVGSDEANQSNTTKKQDDIHPIRL